MERCDVWCGMMWCGEWHVLVRRGVLVGVRQEGNTRQGQKWDCRGLASCVLFPEALPLCARMAS